mgnify:CR=1 FL=1
MGLLLIHRVTGLFPFGSRMDAMLTEKIMNGLFARNDSFNRLTTQCGSSTLCHQLVSELTTRTKVVP